MSAAAIIPIGFSGGPAREPATRSLSRPVRVESQSPARSTRGSADLVLTRRGRAVVGVMAVLLAAALGLAAQRAEAGVPLEAVPVAVHVVGPGDTLWAIARSSAAPGQDVRDALSHIEELNGLETSGLAVGQQILVPSR